MYVLQHLEVAFKMDRTDISPVLYIVMDDIGVSNIFSAIDINVEFYGTALTVF